MAQACHMLKAEYFALSFIHLIFTQVAGIGRPLPGPPMKITVTGNVTRGTSGTPVSTLGSHTQKVKTAVF